VDLLSASRSFREGEGNALTHTLAAPDPAVAAVLAIVTMQQDVVFAKGRKEQQLTWTQAAPLLQGHEVDVWLSSNERLSGRVLSTTADSVDIDVRLRFEVGTNRKLPDGVTSIPSDSLLLITRRPAGGKEAGVAWAVILPMLQCAPQWISKVFMVASIALSVWITRKRTLVIRIVPDNGPPA